MIKQDSALCDNMLHRNAIHSFICFHVVKWVWKETVPQILCEYIYYTHIYIHMAYIDQQIHDMYTCIDTFSLLIEAQEVVDLFASSCLYHVCSME